MNCEYAVSMGLKPQDLLIPLYLINNPESQSTGLLAKQVGLSVGETHNSLKRCVQAKLLRFDRKYIPFKRSLEEFMIYGMKYAFYAELGEITRGIPTAHAAPPLSEFFLDNGDLPPVWADANGTTRGYQLIPIYSSIPKIALTNPTMYEWFSLLDALRIGQVRERQMATEIIKDRLRNV
jgi:hypothetical protein